MRPSRITTSVFVRGNALAPSMSLPQRIAIDPLSGVNGAWRTTTCETGAGIGVTVPHPIASNADNARNVSRHLM
jgi:hypothetical protein